MRDREEMEEEMMSSREGKQIEREERIDGTNHSRTSFLISFCPSNSLVSMIEYAKGSSHGSPATARASRTSSRGYESTIAQEIFLMASV